MKSLVILGTARGDGNTLAAIRNIMGSAGYDLVDLRNLKIAPYSYDEIYPPDDEFLRLAELMQKVDHVVFATPVYWYSMSCQLKTFFDRLSDLISTHKAVGRSLKGKSTALIATGSDSELPAGFEIPFLMTSKYFEMNFKGSSYIQTS